MMPGKRNWLGYAPEESTDFWTGIIGGLVMATAILGPVSALIYWLVLHFPWG